MKSRKSGFTLVEILIVVIILGILAAVVIPQFSDASDDTRSSSAMTNLKTIRSQLQLYKAQHTESWPTDFGNQMTLFTDAGGVTNASQTAVYRFGPYLLRVPANPYTGISTVTTVADAATGYTAAADMTFGWWFNSATGEFRCHVPDSVTTPDETQVNGM
jgi:general secretion pathway protein G